MLEPWQYLIVALAAFRFTRFFVFDSLMGANLDSKSKFSRRLDNWAYTADGRDKSFWQGKIADLLVCPYCLGFWITLVCWAAWVWGPQWAQYVLMLFALAGGQSLLNHLDRK